MVKTGQYPTARGTAPCDMHGTWMFDGAFTSLSHEAALFHLVHARRELINP
jgi:hypothetical protein